MPFAPGTLDSTEMEGIVRSDSVLRLYEPLIRAFYQHREYQYAWFISDTLSMAAANFLELSAARNDHGAAQEMRDGLRAEVERTLGERAGIIAERHARARLEVKLTGAYFHHADHYYGGLVHDPRGLDWYIPRRKKDYSRLLDTLVKGRADLRSIEPVHPQYQKLKQWLKTYEQLNTGRWMAMPELRATIWPGDSSTAVRAVRQQLVAFGDLANEEPVDVLDADLSQAIISFRERMGLPEGAFIDRQLLDALSIPADTISRKLLLNMERCRWLPESTPDDLVLVNLPEFKAHIYEHGLHVAQMDVVVGSKATRTTIFSDSITWVVLSPYWDPPSSIVEKEILPAWREDSGYLSKKEMEVWRNGKLIPASSIDASTFDLSAGYVIRQRPGQHNALGGVKFLFPNAYDTYMHDTPAKDLFGESTRAFSHGCIRLSDARWLASHLLRQESSWSEVAIDAAMNAGTEKWVRIRPGIPVAMVYFTAWVDDRGRLNLRDDIYGHDARLERELFGTPSRPF